MIQVSLPNNVSSRFNIQLRIILFWTIEVATESCREERAIFRKYVTDSIGWKRDFVGNWLGFQNKMTLLSYGISRWSCGSFKLEIW